MPNECCYCILYHPISINYRHAWPHFGRYRALVNQSSKQKPFHGALRIIITALCAYKVKSALPSQLKASILTCNLCITILNQHNLFHLKGASGEKIKVRPCSHLPIFAPFLSTVSLIFFTLCVNSNIELHSTHVKWNE